MLIIVPVGFQFWLLAVSLVASALGGMLGMAGGIFLVPVLTVFGRLDIHTAIGASIVSVIACSCASAKSFLGAHLTNVRLALVLEVATTCGALTGVLLSRVFPASYLFLAFALVLLLSAQQMLPRHRKRDCASSPGQDWHLFDSSYPDPVLGCTIQYRVRRLPLGMALMYGAGLVSALLGIGSGVLKVPAMDTALRLPIKVSSATSSFMIGVTAAASAGAYFILGDVVSSIAGPVVLGSVIGSLLGARILLAVSNDRIRLLLVAVLLLLAAQMIMQTFGIIRINGGV
jgi:uncharacterized protein